MSYEGGAGNGAGNGDAPPPPPPPPPPVPGGQGRPAGSTNNMAMAAMWCGIAGFLCVIPAILGIVFGFIAKGQIRDGGYSQRGDGMATAGIVLGIVWIALSVLLFATGAVDFDFDTNS